MAGDLTFEDFWGDQIDRYQYDEVIAARRRGKRVGAIHLAHFKHPVYEPKGSVSIQYIEVIPSERRTGVATALFHEAERRYGKLKHTNQTEEGAAWVASLSRRSGRARYRRR